MVKINIYGSGISSLTLAHELVERGFKVTIYEKDTIPGGMARTFRYPNGVPTEHSWRGYGPFYKNTFNIMKRIPINTNDKKTIEHMNQYTIQEIERHNTITDLWTHYNGKVYNLSNFVKDHPGGGLILQVGGKDLKVVWKKLGYSWHETNSNVINALSRFQIGTVKETFDQNTVFDNLQKRKLEFKLLKNNLTNKKISISLSDIPYLYYLLIKVLFSNRRRDDYYKKNFSQLIKNISKESYHFLVDFLAGPGYGFDKNNISYAHYALFMYLNFREKEKYWQVLNQPTSEGWIDPWTKYLKKKGVKFYFNSELKKVIHKNGKIDYCIVNDKKVYADEHILALDPYSLLNVITKSKIESLKNKIFRLVTINNQISFRLGFNKKIEFPKKNLGFVLVDSPYNITFYAQEDHWKKGVKLGMNGQIKTLISGTIITSYNKGILHKKTATSLSKEKLLEEIVAQFFTSKDFKSLPKSGISKDNIIFKEIFSDWEYKNKYLQSKNKKWVNNSINQEYRPDGKTKFNNLYITGSHCKTSVDVWSMEGAVESGKKTSNFILDKYKKNKVEIFHHDTNFGLFSYIDDLFYAFNLPHYIDILIIVSIIYFIYKMRERYN